MRVVGVILGILGVTIGLAALPAGETNTREAQYKSDQPASVGNLLVASEKLGDPNFAESVILIVQHDEDEGTVGLVINRRTEVPLSRVFPKTKHATADPVYMGGPVETTAVQALLRIPEKADRTAHIVADIYLSGSKELIEKSVESRLDSLKFRLYLGYAGWASGQLEAEIRLGAWSVLNASPKLVFDRDPDSLWSRLTNESKMQIAHRESYNLFSLVQPFSINSLSRK